MQCVLSLFTHFIKLPFSYKDKIRDAQIPFFLPVPIPIPELVDSVIPRIDPLPARFFKKT